MNHKGQVLVLFLLLLPILLLLSALVIDIGFSYIEKRKIENVVKDTILYGLDHLEEEENVQKINMANLLKQNISDIFELSIRIQNDTIKIRIEKKIKPIFFTKPQTIQVSYKGTKVESEKKIQKE